MNVSDTLNLAAELIEERGWTTNIQGWGDSESPVPLCIEGGIMAALGIDSSSNASVESCPAYAAVVSHLGGRIVNLAGDHDDRLWMWNDVVARDQTEVIEVLRATAVIEAAREARERQAVSA